jgi:hypothetical protein
MFQAQYLPAPTTPTEVFSPWMPRGGDYVRITAELVAKSATGQLVVKLFTKNSEDTSDGADVDSGTPTEIELTAVGRETVEWNPSTGSGLKELVRYKFIATGEAATDWVIFRVLAPVWFDAVTA